MFCDGMVAEVPEGIKPDTPAVAVAVQLKVAVDGFEVRTMAAVGNPEHTVCDNTELVTVGAVFKSKSACVVVDAPQLLVTVNETI